MTAMIRPDRLAKPLVRFEKVTKRFGAVIAVNQLDLDIGEREFFALLGPSGCGKSTLLRLLAGFETPDEGRIVLAGQDIGALPPYRRPVNMMFQNYALFPHLTVAGNIAFGLRQEGLPRSEVNQRVQEMLALVQLKGLDARKPHQLSGGQRQRVALARSLAKRPQVLLLDEPMAALDKKLREDTQFELSALQERLRTTFVIVTHDQEEAMTVAHRIGVMNQGRLEQVATPVELYEQPSSRWVADFIGDVNLLDGRVVAQNGGAVVVEAASGDTFVTTSREAVIGAPVSIAVRPEKMTIHTTPPPSEPHRNCIAGEVTDIAYRGGVSSYKVTGANKLVLKATAVNAAAPRTSIASGDRVWLTWPAEVGVVVSQ